jgi:hypothetical protein
MSFVSLVTGLLRHSYSEDLELRFSLCVASWECETKVTLSTYFNLGNMRNILLQDITVWLGFILTVQRSGEFVSADPFFLIS